MRTILSLLLTLQLFLTISLAGVAQQYDDNTIILKDFGRENFTKVEDLLVHNFYLVKEFDSERFRFSTYPRPFSKYPLAMNIQISIHGFMKDNDLYVFAYYGHVGTDRMETYFEQRSVFTRRRNLSITVSFEEMMRVFALLEHPMQFDRFD